MSCPPSNAHQAAKNSSRLHHLSSRWQVWCPDYHPLHGLIWRDQACRCTCTQGLVHLTTLFLLSDHFQSSVKLLKGVDKCTYYLVTLVNVRKIYSSKSWVDGYCILLRLLVPIWHVVQRKTTIRSHKHCNINSLYHKYKDWSLHNIIVCKLYFQKTKL